MRRFPIEDEPRKAGLIERGVDWLFRTMIFSLVAVAAGVGISVWSTWKAIAQIVAAL